MKDKALIISIYIVEEKYINLYMFEDKNTAMYSIEEKYI